MPSLPVLVLLVFLVVVVVQLFFYLFFFARLAFYKRSSLKKAQANYPISIIVCAFNEEANLTKNLPNLLEQDYILNGRRNFEVVVVNDNSEDGTFFILNQLKEKYPHLHIVNLTQDAKLIPGKKFALSMGIKSARYDHMLLTDADCVPRTNQWLREMTSQFDSQIQILLGYGPYMKQKGWLNKKIRFETLHSAIQYLSFALAKMPYMGVGRNLAYHRELFNRNKGFSSHHHIVSGDDDLFINQVATSQNVAVVIEPSTFMYSKAKQTEDDWKYQKKRHLSTGKYYRSKHKFLLGLYAFSHFATWILFAACCFFPAIIIYAASAFVLRWLVQWYIFQRVCGRLREGDLINYIWLFDIWLLWYNFKSLPAIFLKQKLHWK